MRLDRHAGLFRRSRLHGAPEECKQHHQKPYNHKRNDVRTTISEGENMTPKRTLGLAIAASSTLALSAALAATGTPERARGTIVSATADSMTVDTHADKPVTVALTGDTSYLKVEKSNLNKVEKGSCIGTATKDVGGKQVALEVVIFPPSMRGAGEGHYAWDKIRDTTLSGARRPTAA
jgi:hypothetical protein